MNPPGSGKVGTQTPISIQRRTDGWVPGDADLSTSYGGTIYATTPGGTKIAYDRSALMYIRNSPLSKGPSLLPSIPGVTAPDQPVERPAQARSTPERPSGAAAGATAPAVENGGPPAGSAAAAHDDDDAAGVFEME